MNEIELTWLAYQAQKALITIEVGSYLGRSTTALCDNTAGHVYSIDPYQGDYKNDDGQMIFHVGDDVMAQFYQNMEHHIKSGKLTHFRTTFDNYFPHRYPADFVFIDGDHREEPVENDIIMGLANLRDGGILSGHDYIHTDWPAVKKVVDRCFPIVNVVESIWWIRKS